MVLFAHTKIVGEKETWEGGSEGGSEAGGRERARREGGGQGGKERAREGGREDEIMREGQRMIMFVYAPYHSTEVGFGEGLEFLCKCFKQAIFFFSSSNETFQPV